MLPIRTIFETDIDFQTHGIEVISDAYKFILPIPKLQEELIIKNYTDQSNQSVAVDGTGIIIFNFTSKEDAENISLRIEQLINEQLVNKDTKDINALVAQHVRNIVDKAHTQLELNDIYPTNKDFVRTKLKPICGATEFYGLHQRNITDYCKAVYIKGSGEFQGPTTQKFIGSAVI